MSKEFWNEWIQADEIGKQKLIETLPLFSDIKCPLFTPSVLNSYFEDLYLTMKQLEE